jgi:S1-C subfamily serine protease
MRPPLLELRDVKTHFPLHHGFLLQRHAGAVKAVDGVTLSVGCGEVLGLNTSGLTHGSALTIPVKFAWRIADSLAKHGSVKRGYIGVRTQVVELTEAAQKALKREQATGLLVAWLESDGPAERGGILVGDILVAVAGQPVGDPDDLFASLNSETVGQAAALEVVRGGKPATVKVTVGERK